MCGKLSSPGTLTVMTNEADNNSRSLPRKYAILLNWSFFIIQIPVCFQYINYSFSVFFTLFAVNIDSIVSFDHSSKASGWQPKAHTNLNFQPENVFIVLILTL